MDIGKLETTPVDLNKLSDTVKNEVAKKTEYNELLKKLLTKSYKNIKTKHVLVENELNEPSKKLETISTKEITARIKE